MVESRINTHSIDAYLHHTLAMRAPPQLGLRRETLDIRPLNSSPDPNIMEKLAMERSVHYVLIVAATVALYLAARFPLDAVATESHSSREAAEFTHFLSKEWINSSPLTLAELRGKVILIDFWTFDCWNCYRSFPWLKSVETRYESRGLQVIGVHTPEFEHEKVYKNIAAKVKEFELHHPIMIDNDFSYWNAMGNRYWPTYYLIDKRGRVRSVFVGETHAGDARAIRIEAAIEGLLAES